LTLAPNSVLTGYSFQFVTGGTFQTTNAAAPTRQLTFRLKFNTTTFLAKSVTFNATIAASTAWNARYTLMFTGSDMITNFVFSYNPSTSLNQLGGNAQSSNLFTATSSNTLNFTAQWTNGNTLNTITSNYAVFSKLY